MKSESKLPVGVTVSVTVCMSLYISVLWGAGDLSRGVLAVTENEWINECSNCDHFCSHRKNIQFTCEILIKKKKKGFTKTHYWAGEWRRDRKKTTSKNFLSADFRSDDQCSEPESELNWRGGKCRLYFSHLHLLLLRAISEQKRKSEKRREKKCNYD